MVLVKELQSIGLDITVAKKGGQEVDLMSDLDSAKRATPKRTLSDIDSELLNINFFETPGTFNEQVKEKKCQLVQIILII